MTLLTIIIPSYNRSALLEKTLHSLALQKNKDFHVILVDHGSNDNTSSVVEHFQFALSLEYYWISRQQNDPGYSRDFGVGKTKTPYLAFLDSGVVVPSFYVDEHIRFHQTHTHHVGLGMYHGHKINKPQDDQWKLILDQIEVDDASEFFTQDPDLCDIRQNANVQICYYPWLYGWTGNLSLPREAYHAVGGFDPEQKYGFEDLDLSYRLFRHGMSFAQVENGWAIHLPHPRPSFKELQTMEQRGWRRSYERYRSLAMEVAWYSELIPSKAEKAFAYLSELGKDFGVLPSLPSSLIKDVTHPSLCIGGTQRDATWYTYLALADEQITFTEILWSCFGIYLPLPDQALQTVVVSDVWKWLGVSFHPRHLSLLECLIGEIKRTAKRAIFMDSPWLPERSDRDLVSTQALSMLCQKYQLPFHLFSAT